MPILKIITNVAKNEVPADFLQKASASVASLTSKPESVSSTFSILTFIQYVQIVLETDQLVTFGGSSGISAHVELGSVGGFGSKIGKIAAELTSLIQTQLKFLHQVYGNSCQ